MVVVEVLCGSGRLTASLKQEGFDAFGIDHVVLKHAACSVLKLDLLCRESAAHLWRIVADPAVQFIHFAPPCGTASRWSRAGEQQWSMVRLQDGWAAEHVTAFADDLNFRWVIQKMRDCAHFLEDLNSLLRVLANVGLQVNSSKSSLLLELRGTRGLAWLRKHIVHTHGASGSSVTTIINVYACRSINAAGIWALSWRMTVMKTLLCNIAWHRLRHTGTDCGVSSRDVVVWGFALGSDSGRLPFRPLNCVGWRLLALLKRVYAGCMRK